MVDAGESVSVTVKREFMEEATSTARFTPTELERNKHMLDELFAAGVGDPFFCQFDPQQWRQARADLTALG